MDRAGKAKIQSIHQALLAANSSLKLAKRLLGELERQGGPSPRELPGEFGSYDGHFMVTESGEKYPVPENYASKSKLVYGDKLKRIVQEDGTDVFKQIERTRRQELAGILAKKDGNWHVVTEHGSYEVLPSAVKYWEGKEGEEAVVIVPQDEKRVPFAALKEVKRETGGDLEKAVPAEEAQEASEVASAVVAKPESRRVGRGVGRKSSKAEPKPEPAGEAQPVATEIKPAAADELR